MREFRDHDGEVWHALAVSAVVAHGKMGTRLAFRRGSEEDSEPILGSITFNSEAAADFALRTLGEKELRRRLDLARAAVHGV
jgi:hypothetical protein